MKTVRVFDDENLIIIENDHTQDIYEFFPETKIFKLHSSAKEDNFDSYKIYEYKISTNPVEIYTKLLEDKESSLWQIGEYLVSDGVVLESEMKESDYSEETIDRLKKEIDWNKMGFFYESEIIFYILSKHPEIISKQEYRKFLRQTSEKIKSGVLKPEESSKVELLEYIEKLLRQKETVSEEEKSDQGNDGISIKRINTVVYLLSILLIVLRLADVINWSWIIVLSPILLLEGLGFILSFLTTFFKK